MSVTKIVQWHENIHVLVLGAVLRVLLYMSPFQHALSKCVELVSPVSSYHRVLEGLFLQGQGMDPYIGDWYHQAPLFLPLFSLFGDSIFILYIALDVMIALLLFGIASEMCQRKTLLSSWKDQYWLPNRVVLIYMLNPLAIISCVSLNTGIFTYFLTLLSILAAMRSFPAIACVSLAVATYLSIYPGTLFIALVCIVHFSHSTSKNWLYDGFTCLLYFAASLGTLLSVSFLQENSWNFIYETYGFVYTSRDLSPNLGVFWYYLAESFPEKRKFFIFLLQSKTFVFVVPLALRLYRFPLFLTWITLGLVTSLKPYLVAGDFLVHLSMAPLFFRAVGRNKYNIIYFGVGIGCMFAAPVLRNMWLYTNVGNANYYYAMTLVLVIVHGYFLRESWLGLMSLQYEESQKAQQKKGL